MDVENVLTRADVLIREDASTIWVESRSNKPLNKKEALILERMKRDAGYTGEIVFLPEPV